MEQARILFVDDEQAFLRSARRLFCPPHRVVTAERPSRGLEAVRDEEFDVVVSDYRMPEMDGVEFLERVQKLRPSAVRMLVTAAHDFDTVVSAVNRGSVFRFVAKPFEVDDLIHAVNDAVDVAKLRADRDRLAAELVRRNDELSQTNARLDAKVRERTQEVLNALVDALDYRDSETQAHSRRVAGYARCVAERLGLRGAELSATELGALLHDVGKIGVPDAILRKRGPLTMEEWTEMRRHPGMGGALVQRISFLAEAARVVREHHERWDGKGYPRGLAGEEICIGARIFSVVDTFDAITSDRPYRAAQSVEAARAEIRRNAGTQFDPRVVEAFEAISDAQLSVIRREAESLAFFLWRGEPA